MIDNTNPSIAVRRLVKIKGRLYIDIAKKHDVSIRCYWFQASIDLAMHNNAYRQAAGGKKQVPKMAYTFYTKDFQEPTISEGFQQVKLVNFVLNFDGKEAEFEEAEWKKFYH